MSSALTFEQALGALPLIAILRGLTPAESVDVAETLWGSGFRILEVPLNSPQPLESIERMRAALGDRAIVGAGTVLTREAVIECNAAGAQIIVSPNTDTVVIHATRDLGLLSLPAFATPTEAFAALSAGADGLKLFPAEAFAPAVLRAMRAVLPKQTRIFPVGGIDPQTMQPYLDAGASGFGIGSALYKPGRSLEALRSAAEAFVRAVPRP